MPQKIILDVDTGTDDAVAILLAWMHPEIELIAITCVNGNVPVDYAIENTLRVLDVLGINVPVFSGMSNPVVAPNPVPHPSTLSEPSIWGDYLDLPPAQSKAQDQHAIDFLIEHYGAGSEAILVGVGPLTNIAAALKRVPDLAEQIPALYVMGGGHKVGNVNTAIASEFNIWVDPEAAKIVFNSGIDPMTLLPLDATHQAVVSKADCDRLRATGTSAGHLAAKMIEKRIVAYNGVQPLGEPDVAPVHDALTVAALVQPDLIETHYLHVDVDIDGDLTRGRTVIDHHNRGKFDQRYISHDMGRIVYALRGGGFTQSASNVHVALGADREGFFDLLMDVLSE